MNHSNDLIVQGFKFHLEGKRFTREEMIEYYKHVRALPLPMSVRKAMRDELKTHVKLSSRAVICKMLQDTGEFKEDEINDAADFVVAFDDMRGKLMKFDVSISKLFGLKFTNEEEEGAVT